MPGGKGNADGTWIAKSAGQGKGYMLVNRVFTFPFRYQCFTLLNYCFTDFRGLIFVAIQLFVVNNITQLFLLYLYCLYSKMLV